MPTAWMVFKIATESALKIRLSSSADDGSLEKRLSIDLVEAEVLAKALLMTPLATKLLLTRVDEAPERLTKSALG